MPASLALALLYPLGECTVVLSVRCLKGMDALDRGGKLQRALVLVGLVLGVLSLSLALHRPGMMVFFFLWASIEMLWSGRCRSVFRRPAPAKISLSKEKNPFPALGTYFSDWSPSSVLLLDEEMSNLKNGQSLSQENRRELERFSDVVELKKLFTFAQVAPKKKIRQLFVLNRTFKKDPETTWFELLGAQDIIESATLVAHLYQKVGETAENGSSYYRYAAQAVLQASLEMSYSEIVLSRKVDNVVDQIQQHGGVSFLILNLVKANELENARTVAQRLLKEEWELDDDLRSALYWLAELLWFSREMQAPIKDYETSMRYLYHLCFTAPERAHFLEIDSQYFSQFETVNELAREAFLFKENLIHRFLQLWACGEGLFDASYKEVMEVMTQLKSKIYEDRATWQQTWNREEESFSKEYLYVVEGNLSYAGGRFDEARSYYEKALKANSNLRSALLNSVFAYACLGEDDLHAWMLDRILNREELFPSNLYVAGNSCLLIGQDKRAEEFYETLIQVPGWALKTNLYRATFCFENRLFEKALLFARLAEKENPEDSSILYHLSLCYSAVGEKERALEIVKRLEDRPHWLDYYRFTLERDAGKEAEAAETLLTMPAGYFEDPEELEAALAFAKNRKDLNLLRHLKNR